ncbi:MAG: hypothetical protein G3M78_07790 [Candidatus Nitrohelix vancouverensis]|uniref:Deoxyhypusine synthase n=1 Tax=Candidatus Nitrohelix vancouverensis TaxID=2705534 RepID=A0A7T0C2E1_9BACT|nr:MAG: hypothetical protein G3M78_07790 [Candidatus Nitrohelix vancouverensis]
MPSPRFDRSALHIQPLEKRRHDLGLESILPLKELNADSVHPKLQQIAKRMVRARIEGRANVIMIGAHVIRSGVQNYLIDLMKRGYLNCLAMNGAGIIHDYEFASIGATTESVARYIKTGEFGLWRETGVLNDIINTAYRKDDSIGMGEAVGQNILDEKLPHAETSLFAWACKLQIPATVHVGIGYDIIHEHPNCNGAATGALSYNDFLKFAAVIQNLEGGAVMNFGSSVMAPEVYLKALSMARNVASQNGAVIKNFATLVCDLHDLPENFDREPSREDPAYFFRPWKTMLVRTVSDGGESFYVKGRHADTIPALWTAINHAETNR